jgi:hypothetical protein
MPLLFVCETQTTFYQIPKSMRLASEVITTKWLREQKALLKTLLSKPMGKYPRSWDYELQYGDIWFYFHDFCEELLPRLHLNEGAYTLVRKADKLASLALDKLRNELRAIKDLQPEDTDFDDVGSHLEWAASRAVYERLVKDVETCGDLFKYIWTVDKQGIKTFVDRTLKKMSTREKAFFTGIYGDYSLSEKNDYLKGFDKSVLRFLKRSKSDFDPLGWFDGLVASLKDEVQDKSNLYTQFDLYGMKVVVEDQTVTPAQTEEYVSYFKEAYHKLKAKGFVKAWYGTLFVSCDSCGGVNSNTGGGVGGSYAIMPDTVQIHIRPKQYLVDLVVHELGHRFWFKQMSNTQREKFKSLVKVHTKPKPHGLKTKEPVLPVEVGDRLGKLKKLESEVRKELRDVKNTDVFERQTMRSNLRNLVFKAHGYARLLRVNPEAQKEFNSFLEDADNLRKTIGDASFDLKLDNYDSWFRAMSDLVEEFFDTLTLYVNSVSDYHNELSSERMSPETKEWWGSYEENPATVPAVSDYGRSDIDEAFAEAFMHYVLELDMTRDQLESFRSVFARTNPMWNFFRSLSASLF